MRHLDEGTIHAWLDGALNEEKARQAEEHAARCTQCAAAVADARGFIAGASRILLALDDVPRGVVGSDVGSALGARETARRSELGARRSAVRIPGWVLKAAASVLVVATTAVLVSRYPRAAPRMESGAQPLAATGAAPAPVETTGLVQTPPAVPATNAPTVVADNRTDALLKAKAAESTVVISYAAKPAAEAAAPAAAPPAVRQLALTPADSPRLDTNGVPLANQVSTVAPRMASIPSGSADRAAVGGVAKRSIGGPEIGLPSGMRIVSDKTVTAQARVVQKRVYEVSPGVEVTYSIFEPVPARDGADASAAPANDSGAAEKDENADSDAGVNTIKWSDSTGADFMLSGRLPLDSLRVIRQKLTTVHRQ